MDIPISLNVDTSKLLKIFDNMSESYKIFWFKAILLLIETGKTVLTFNEIIDQMIINAWYMVSEYKLNLGPNDTLEKIVIMIGKKEDIKSFDKKDKILNYLEEKNDKDINAKKDILALNVPYRLQAPFLSLKDSSVWNRRDDIIAYINNTDNAIYSIDGKNRSDSRIYISREWMDYFNANIGILKGWVDYNLIAYLQRRNPTVPGIIDKIYPPQKRQLNQAKKYWKAIINEGGIIDIYTGQNMYGRDLSIDHFIPWSYVASDELWNLIPTDKSTNSKKSNNLPKWSRYFKGLCEVEYKAYKLLYEDPRVYNLFEKCKKENLNNEEVIYKLYKPGLDVITFSNQLNHLMRPIYAAAKNMGFAEWVLK